MRYPSQTSDEEATPPAPAHKTLVNFPVAPELRAEFLASSKRHKRGNYGDQLAPMMEALIPIDGETWTRLKAMAVFNNMTFPEYLRSILIAAAQVPQR